MEKYCTSQRDRMYFLFAIAISVIIVFTFIWDLASNWKMDIKQTEYVYRFNKLNYLEQGSIIETYHKSDKPVSLGGQKSL